MAKKNLYKDKGPRIEPAPAKGDDNKSGHMAEAAKEAEKTATDTNAGVSNVADEGPKQDVMAGTDRTMGMSDHHAQAAERKDAHHARMMEHVEMYGRHENEHLMRATGNHTESHEEMSERHRKEMQVMHTAHERKLQGMSQRHVEITKAGGHVEKDVGAEKGKE